MASYTYPFLTELQLKIIEYDRNKSSWKIDKSLVRSDVDLAKSLLLEEASMEQYDQIKADCRKVHSC